MASELTAAPGPRFDDLDECEAGSVLDPWQFFPGLIVQARRPLLLMRRSRTRSINPWEPQVLWRSSVGMS
jgi:hypothetical protein